MSDVKEEPKDEGEKVEGKKEASESGACTVKTEDGATEDFDPVKAMEWENGIGSLPGSSLKVCLWKYDVPLNIKYFSCYHFELI